MLEYGALDVFICKLCMCLETENKRERERNAHFPPHFSCVLTATHIVCLQLSRLDLYSAELSTDTAFSLNMLPSETLQIGSSLSPAPSDNAHRVTLVPSSSPMTIWIRFNTGVHHRIELRGEEETAVLVSEMKAGLPLIGWMDGERKRAVDVVLWSDNEKSSLMMKMEGEGVEKIEGKVVAREMNRGPPVFGDVKVYTKSDGSVGYSIAMVMEDFTVNVLKPKGRILISAHLESFMNDIIITP